MSVSMMRGTGAGCTAAASATSSRQRSVGTVCPIWSAEQLFYRFCATSSRRPGFCTMDVEGKDAGERARPNILIAGTPGCGKTTTSALIAVRESSARTPGSSSVSLTAHSPTHTLLPLLSDPPCTHHRPNIVCVAPQDATQLRHIDMGKVVRLSTPTAYSVSLSLAPLLARTHTVVLVPFRRCRCPSASWPPSDHPPTPH